MYNRAIFWFRQDLRIEDNIGLAQALVKSKELIPIFILDEKIIQTFGGTQDPRFGFLSSALKSLDTQLKKIGLQLYIFKTNTLEFLPQILQQLYVQAIFTNMCYDTPGMQRDSEIKYYCRENKIRYQTYNDYLLVDIKSIKPYKVFSPYFKVWKQNLPKYFEIQNIQNSNTLSPELKKQLSLIPEYVSSQDIDKILPKEHIYRPIDGYTTVLKTFDFSTYEHTKNFPSHPHGVSRLSPYLRFGVLSIRKLYNHIQDQYAENYLAELAWREFWHQIAMYFPYTREKAFIEKRQNIQWENNKSFFDKFCKAQTGYPIIDAAILQLKEKNWMHNRLRMIVASFLTKDLLIDWKWGEQFFKKYLLDYEEVINIGNWQRSASVGADPKPIRIFSPIKQSERFDNEAIFIKKYIPQLKKYLPKQLHNPIQYPLQYYQPIVDHAIQVPKAKKIFYSSV